MNDFWASDWLVTGGPSLNHIYKLPFFLQAVLETALAHQFPNPYTAQPSPS